MHAVHIVEGRNALQPSIAIPIVGAAIALLVHLAGNPHYGFIRDELYFIICGRHPQVGYVDQPPLIPLLAALTQIFGHSLLALRTISAICAAACVYVTCLLVREFDGGAFAEILAATAALLAPVLIAFGMVVAPDSINLWTWPLLMLFVLRIAKGGDPRLWLAAGAVAGVAGNAKYSVIFLAAALMAGLLLAPQRRALATPWFAGGAALAAAMLLPNFLWQAMHSFPMLELLHNGQLGKNVVLSPLEFVVSQLAVVGPIPALLALAGLGRLFAHPASRWLGYAFVLLFAMMIALHGKNNYPAFAYPAVFAAGGAAVESWVRPIRGGARLAVQTAVAVMFALLTLPLVPIVLPVLSEARYVAYSGILQRAGLLPAPTEHNRPAVLGQTYADMHGWPRLAATVTEVYRSLPSGKRSQAAIVASNYGEASAILFFGPPDLPPVLSGHNQFFLWGTRGVSGNVIIAVNGDCGASEHLFRSSRRAATFRDPYVMPYENDLPIMVCTGITRPLSELWPSLKNFK